MSGVVLVVEDDRELLELVRRYLKRSGHAVHTTGSGAMPSPTCSPTPPATAAPVTG